MVDSNFFEAQARVLARYELSAQQHWIDVPVIQGRAQVLIAGVGAPVVYLNGVGVPAAMFAPLIAEVEGVRHYAIDLPAFGLTATTPDFADDLRANAVQFVAQSLDALGLEQPVIVSNSLGSLFATWLAIDKPERVGALAHIGCPALAMGTSAPLPMRLLATRLGPLILKAQPPSPRQVKQLSKMVNEYPLPAEIADLILATEELDHFDHAFQSVLRRLLRLRGSRPDIALTADQLSQVKASTLLVFGADDPMGAAPIGRAVASAMQDAELHIVEGGHAPWIHQSDQISPLLNGFLARTTAQRRS